MAVDYVPADLSTLESTRAFAAAVLEKGTVDVVVQNAAATNANANAPSVDIPDDAWFADLQLNFLGVVRLDRELLPAMRERGSGVIVHISSISSHYPQPGQASYAASKAALNAYSRTLAASDRASWVTGAEFRIDGGIIPTF